MARRRRNIVGPDRPADHSGRNTTLKFYFCHHCSYVGSGYSVDRAYIGCLCPPPWWQRLADRLTGLWI